jgi:hypothetical protein
MFYGMTVVLFFHCMQALLWPRAHGPPKYYLVIYTFVLFSLGTIFVALNLRSSVLAFIDNRNFPGGPEAYALSVYSSPLIITPNVCFVISNLLADGLLMYRCKVIWTGKPWILALPFIMYLGSTSMGIMFIYESSSPNSNVFAQGAVDFGLPYFALSTSLNVLLTLLISIRLMLHQYRVKGTSKIGGRRNLPYNAIVAMLVESSALYSIFSLLFLGTYAAGNSASAIFLPILSQTQIIAPLLIISRVASQRAYTSVGPTLDSKPASSMTRRFRFKSNTTNVDLFPLEESPVFSTFEDRSKEDGTGLANSSTHGSSTIASV